MGIFKRSFNELGTAIGDAFKKTIDDAVGLSSNTGFLENLKNNLFPSKESIQGQLINVDSLIPKIDQSNANDILRKIKSIEAGTNKKYSSFQDLYDRGKEQDKWIAEYAQSTQGQIRSTEGVIAANEAARVSASDYNKELNNLTLGAKAASAGMQMLSAVGNMAVIFAVTKVIELAVQAWDNYVHRLENARNATADAVQNFESLKASADDVDKKLTELNEQIQSLDPITNAHKISELKEQSAELENQNKILDERRNLSALDTESKAVEALTIKSRSDYVTTYAYDDYGTPIEMPAYTTEAEELQAIIDASDAYVKAIKDAAEEKKRLEKSGQTDTWDYLRQNHIITQNTDAVKKARERASELYSHIEENSKGLVGATQNGIDLKDIIDNLAESYGTWIDLLNSNDSTTIIPDPITNQTDTASLPEFNIADEKVTEKIDLYQNKLTALSSAIETIKNGKLSGSQLLDLQKKFPELSDTTDDLSLALRRLIDDSASDTIDFLSEAGASDQLIQTIEQMAEEARGLSDVDWSGTFDVFDTADSKLKSLADLTESLGSSYTITAQEARNFSEVFPELLALGQTTSSGLIQFNKDVVTDFINGKQSEIQADIDAQIAQLENRKTFLEGKRAAVQAALDLVTVSANGEIDAENQKNAGISEARENLVQHLIDLGVSEANADAAANELKAGNILEYDRVVAEVSQNVDANLTNSMNDASQNINTQARSIIDNLFGIAQQAFHTSTALSDLGTGKMVSAKKVLIGKVDELATAFTPASITTDFKRKDAESINVDAYKFSEITVKLAQDASDLDRRLDDTESQIELLESRKNISLNHNPSDQAGSGNPGTQPNAEELDAAAGSVKNLKAQLDSLNTVLDNTKPYDQQLETLKLVIAKQLEYNNALKSQSGLYQAEYENALAALPQEWQDIVSGSQSFSITEIPASLKDAVSKAQDFKDKWTSVKQEIIQANSQLDNTKQKMVDLAQAKLDHQIDLIGNQISDIQNKMDEAETMGLQASDKQYKTLIRLSKQEAAVYHNKLQGLMAGMAVMEAAGETDTDNYYKTASAIQSCEDSISQCAQSQAKWNKAMLELPIQYLERDNDDLNHQMDQLKDQQAKLDGTISGVTGHLKEQIDAQEALRDEAEKTAQTQIDAIQEQIDGLEEANDKRQQQLELEQKHYDLERAKNQKTTRVFKEDTGGFVYEADQNSIRDAQESYDDALFNKEIADLDEQIKKIEENRDELLESYDEEISRLQEIMDSWNNITDAIQRAKDMAMADSVLGSGWQDRVTSGDTSDLEHTTGQYEKNDRDQTWIEKQIEANEQLIEEVERYVEAWQMGEISIREARESINEIVGDIAPEMESNNERINSISTYQNQWTNANESVLTDIAALNATTANNIDELTATEMRRAAAQAYSDQWAENVLSVDSSLGMITEANLNAATVENDYLLTRITNLTSFKDSYANLASQIASRCSSIVSSCREAERALRDLERTESHGYASGTRYAQRGLRPVAEGNRPEIVIKDNGSALLAKRETFYPFKGGETVLNPADTRSVLTLKDLTPIDLPQLPFGSRGSTDVTSRMVPWGINGGLPASMIHPSSSSHQGDVTIKIDNISLPRVKDADDFARSVTDGSLKSAIQQKLYQRR